MKKSINTIRQEPPKIRIGKKGITEGIIQEIRIILKRDKIVKIKCLQSIPTESTKAIAKNVSELTNSKVIEIRGKTFILAIHHIE